MQSRIAPHNLPHLSACKVRDNFLMSQVKVVCMGLIDHALVVTGLQIQSVIGHRQNKEFVNHSPAARDLQILLVFYQHPAWFINL